MYPIDALTLDNKNQIKNWIKTTQGYEPRVSIDYFLRFWNKNKIRLFKMFGQQLRIEIPLDKKYFDKPVVDKSKVRSGFVNQKILSTYDYFSYGNKDDSFFPNNLSRFIYQNYYDDVKEYSTVVAFTRLLDKTCPIANLESGKLIYDYQFTAHGKDYTISKGTKYTKAVKRFCDIVGFKPDKTFEEWRNRYSNYRTAQTNPEKMKMVFSIHPFDYITMSDGGDWSTCMSWKNKGCYSASTLEIMSSNNTVVCYAIPANDNSNFSKKVWRSLVVVDEDIILTGKSYPYSSSNMSKFILDNITELAEKNLHWKYQYKNQLYRDLFKTVEGGRDSVRPIGQEYYFSNGHDIVIYTNGFYNDWYEDINEQYWCNRNYVQKVKSICISGPAPCILCGEKIDDFNYKEANSNDFDSASELKVCDSCFKHHICEDCEAAYDKKYSVKTFEAHPFNPQIVESVSICETCLFNRLISYENKDYLTVIWDMDTNTAEAFVDNKDAFNYTVNSDKNLAVIFFYDLGNTTMENYQLYKKEEDTWLKQFARLLA